MIVVPGLAGLVLGMIEGHAWVTAIWLPARGH